jgi:hypothetical protein
MLIE